VKYLVQALLTFGIFVTPIFFEPSMFGALGAQLMMLNPLAPLLEGIRLSLVAGHNLIRPLVVTTADGTEIGRGHLTTCSTALCGPRAYPRSA
jgi:ABC-type polysaccharide/polyol phosphate export permease